MKKELLVIKKNGFGLIDVILASSIFALIITFLVSAFLYGEESTTLCGKRARAILLAEEGLEAARNIRDNNFVNLSDGTHGLTTSNNIWEFSGNYDITDIFTRQIEISTIDEDTKEITSNISWQQNPQRTGLVSLATRLTNWVKTTIADWGNPFQEAILDIPAGNDGAKIQVQGDYAYVVKEGSTPDFVIMNISDPTNPTMVSSMNLPGSPTNISVMGNYAYISSTENSQELQIIDISNSLSPTIIGSYDTTGGADGKGVYVNGSYAYLTRSSSKDDEFFIINISNPATPEFASSLDLGATGMELVVLGDYAYIASQHLFQELQVIAINNPSSLVIVGSYNPITFGSSLSIAGFGDTVVLGWGGWYGTGMLIFNVSSPAHPNLLGTFDAGGDINDISIGKDNTYAFLATNNTSKELQIIDISSLSSPNIIGLLDLSSSLNGIAYHPDKDRVFAVSSSNSEEFVIIAPQ